MRVTVAAHPVPNVSAGRTMLRNRGTSPSPIPCEGSQPSVSEKTITASSPNQKFGMATPINAKTMDTLSMSEYCFFAEMMPTGMPISSATRIPATARTQVLGNRPIT